jgi:uridylate kinase
MKKVMVISLGGSLIAPDEIDLLFLEKFKKTIEKNIRNYKFVIVCGGGSIARKYISALRKSGKSDYLQSMMGISVTRLNARFMSHIFGKDASEGIPHDIKHVENLLRKNDIVFCGALRYHEEETSDSNAAKLAAHFNADFINLTNVSGLFDKNPLVFKNAKFIPEITKEKLFQRVRKLKFKPGQHFVIDQHAMKIIKEQCIKLYILGKNTKELDNLLNGKSFKGTVVY